MAVSVNWSSGVIYVPQADLTFISGVLYELDVDWFRLQLKALEDGEDGMCFPDTHRHETQSTLAGVTYARKIEILSPYTVEFEDGQYVVSCTGANHNISDVKVANQVSLIINNSAGLIVTDTSGLTAQESANLQFMTDIEGGRWLIDDAAKQMVFFKSDGVTEVARFNMIDKDGNPTGKPEEAYERTRV